VNPAEAVISEHEFASVPRNYRKGALPTWHQRRRHRAILGLLKGLNGRVLDYGCGYGDLTYAMSQTHPASGVDLDPVRVAFARREYAPLEFQLCDPRDAPFPDESFDIVTSVVVLNFIADAQAHLRSIRRMLRSGGHLILAYQNQFRVRNAVRRLLGRGPVPSDLWMRSRDEVLGLVENEGLRLIRESHFYDPPSDARRRPGDLLVGTLLQICSALQIRATADYLILVAQKTDSIPSES
jgi:SAM-dependent methyltransferase